ncbi:LEF-2 [Clanis bilineata nucleopolyhedrovirus]|uniref:LEF-2 n=1 Tax=Clanis bilineata nucleopolyhedrovirus TaxID=1307957 RepID=Q0N3Z3_9ABAC|nr:LEF-2 [Clanis bilineata nucleopolyhedrovirus]ABF47450.1 LEF-2 [Clanis bilineata nucleopolyhedrovirus]
MFDRPLKQEPPQTLVWNPSIDKNNVYKNAEYLVNFEDFDLELNPYTVFDQGGICVRVSGLRLYYLLNNNMLNKATLEAVATGSGGAQKKFKRSNKNVCFGSVRTRSDIAELIRGKLKMPPCMSTLLNQLLMRPRGDRYEKRFIFNCYIANLLTCTKCDKKCLLSAMSMLYEHDTKCVREFQTLLIRNEDVYKPPNCVNMQKKNLCNRSNTCKGSNPLCNK